MDCAGPFAVEVRFLSLLFRSFRVPRIAGTALALTLLVSAAQAASISVRQVGTDLTSIPADVGETIEIQLVLDTGGLTFEGYSLGIDFVGGNIDIQSVANQPIGTFVELFGPPVIDNTANTIRNLSQTNFSGSEAPGSYVLSLISVQVTTLGPIIVTPGLFGGVLGLEDGSCPGTVVDCSVSFSTASIGAVPEPAILLVLVPSLLTLSRTTRRRRQPGMEYSISESFPRGVISKGPRVHS